MANTRDHLYLRGGLVGLVLVGALTFGSMAQAETISLQFADTSGRNPSDGSSYFYSQYGSFSGRQDAVQPVPVTGTINEVSVRINCSGNSTNEDSSLFLERGLSAGDTKTLSTTLELNDCTDGDDVYSFTDLDWSVTKNDLISLQFTGATWATNPIGLQINGTLLIETDDAGGLPAVDQGYLYNDGSDNLSWADTIQTDMVEAVQMFFAILLPILLLGGFFLIAFVL